MTEARKSRLDLLAFAKCNALKHLLMESTSAGFKDLKLQSIYVPTLSYVLYRKQHAIFVFVQLKRKPSGQIHHQKRPNTQFKIDTEVPLIRITAHEIYPLKP